MDLSVVALNVPNCLWAKGIPERQFTTTQNVPLILFCNANKCGQGMVSINDMHHVDLFEIEQFVVVVVIVVFWVQEGSDSTQKCFLCGPEWEVIASDDEGITS